ncbi:MAG TPA: hypothetical protein VFX16_04865 [Pseudonocardiaceae bacterium]|nr:hypothetical protein [Pseudonocardiaceae bacterium]
MSEDPRWEPFCLLAQELTADERRQCVLVAAAHAENAQDLRELLDMLGLTAADGRGSEIDCASAKQTAPPEWLAELARLQRQLAAALDADDAHGDRAAS